MTIRGIILDVDGTLVDSNDAHARAWVDALQEAGFDVPFQRVRELIGMGGDNLLPEAARLDKDEEPGKSISQRRSAIFKEHYLAQVKAFPQTRALIEHFQADGLTVAVASSAQADELEHLLKIAQVEDLLDATTSSSDASHSKPDPDIILAVLERTELQPDEVLMLGDTPYDITAANKAGVATIALRCGGWNDDDLRDAHAIYSDPADLLAHYDESPLARHREIGE
jgi:HAD superfamily hydrolase (TIGR01549 family)